MKVISWNVQGAKRSQVLLELQFLKRTQKPNIVFLLETMVNEQNSLRILPRLGFEFYDFVIPNNHSGGLAVLWHNTNTPASILRKEQRAIHMLVHDLTIIRTQSSVAFMLQHNHETKTSFGISCLVYMR